MDALAGASLLDLAALAANLATVLAVLAAFAAAILGWVQFRADQREKARTHAKTVFNQYLAVCVEYPHLSRPAPVGTMSERDKSQYYWFVSMMLNAFEEIIAFNYDDYWHQTILYSLRLHVPYLSNEAFARSERMCYADALLAIVDEVIVRQREVTVQQVETGARPAQGQSTMKEGPE